ncbi:class I SAM-dependent methyltransferase [Marinoscillum sp. MHG1-6]|uniref:class I SAM-dependent methyltransferase n=1 Tax=Marinoscillum sp. MHG1-6 TaxID=2959627 RepID=UPI002158369C|nr:class I SAM-dependent methyltransferase [Marinoscillum sp. MHG1-6]
MSLSSFQISQYLRYRLRAVNAHGLHSPFLYELYTKVIRNKNASIQKEVRALRKATFSSKEALSFTDPRTGDAKKVIVGQWAKKVTSQRKFSVFLINLINWLNVSTVMETGTASGVNCCALSLSTAKKIITLEGSGDIAVLAKQNIEKYGNRKVEVIEGMVQETFKETIQAHQPELIFLDADHRSESIFKYLKDIHTLDTPPKAIIVHDIYWSKDMMEAWRNIISDQRYNLTIDLFQAGIIFPNHPTQKQHFTIQF